MSANRADDPYPACECHGNTYVVVAFGVDRTSAFLDVLAGWSSCGCKGDKGERDYGEDVAHC